MTQALTVNAITDMSESPDIESSSKAYAKRFAGSVGRYFLDVQQQAIESMLPTTDNLQILDVGGGHAQVTPFLYARGNHVTVLGSSEEGRSQLDSLIGKEAYRYQIGDLLALPFDNNSFDVVIAIRLLPHLQQWETFIAELCRVSRSAVIIDYPDKRSVNFFADYFFGAKKAIEKDTRTYRCFSTAELRSTFSREEFTPGRYYRQFFIPMAFHRGLKNSAISRLLEWSTRKIGLSGLFGSPVIHRFERHQPIRVIPSDSKQGNKQNLENYDKLQNGKLPECKPYLRNQAVPLWVDGHAHLHPCFVVDDLLNSAMAQFRANTCNSATRLHACLLVSSLDRQLPSSAAQRVGSYVTAFTPIQCDEPGSLIFEQVASGDRLDIVFGNQIVAKEGIEVLVYGHKEVLYSGKSLRCTVTEALDQQALVILPWGFGKWSGRRAICINETLSKFADLDNGTSQIFVADSAARWRGSNPSSILDKAAELGIRNLPGSDPLPIRSHWNKAGSMGFQLVVSPVSSRPLQRIMRSLRAQEAQPPVFGHGESLPGFALSQLIMQLRKRIRYFDIE